jgi:hypothetical protein
VVDPTSLRAAMHRYGLGAPGQYLRGPERAPAEAMDPVARQVKQTADVRIRAEHKQLVEEVRAHREREKVLLSLSDEKPTQRLHSRERKSGLREGCAVVLASDWHVEETVDAAKVSGRNSYDLTIARQRITRFFGGIDWLLGLNRQAFAIRDMVLWLGGDLISGFIHDDLVEANSLSPIEAILCLRDWLIDGIETLLKDPKLDRLIVPCSYGNHGRNGVKKKIARGAENSYEWLLYNILERHFAGNKRVSFSVARGEHVYVDVYGHVLHFTHGDSVNYGGGVGGITIPLNKAINGWNTVRRADMHHIGHFHQLTWTRDAVVNGSLIGYSPFAYHVKAHYEEPQQAFYVLDSKRGRSITAPIWVSDSQRVAA